MPCVCRTFTKASSVVIFMEHSPASNISVPWQLPRDGGPCKNNFNIRYYMVQKMEFIAWPIAT